MAFASTGIGSVPHTSVGEALEFAFRQDLPFLPQLPRLSPAEAMLASALEGLPGLEVSAAGTCRIDLEAALAAPLERATGLAPSEVSSRCFQPFLARLRAAERPVMAKVQLAGPVTAGWVRTSDGRPAGEHPALVRLIDGLLLGRALAMVRAVRAAGAAAMIFLDEPGLVALPAGASLAGLSAMVRALQAEGAQVGLHCCGETAWARVLGLGADVVSFDASLSLPSLLAAREACKAFFARGGTLGLGVIPTDGAPGLRAEAIRSALPAALHRGGILLTPACGLAGCTVQEAERISLALRELQVELGAG